MRQEALPGLFPGFEEHLREERHIVALISRQPWADYVAEGRRRAMVKKWEISYRGPVLIYSPRYVFEDLTNKHKDKRPLKAVVGYANLNAVERVGSERRWRELKDHHLTKGDRPYGNNTYIYYLDSPVKFKRPLPVTGNFEWYKNIHNELYDHKGITENQRRYITGRNDYYLKIPIIKLKDCLKLDFEPKYPVYYNYYYFLHDQGTNIFAF